MITLASVQPLYLEQTLLLHYFWEYHDEEKMHQSLAVYSSRQSFPYFTMINSTYYRTDAQ
jgi:hypothetical protein